MKRIISFMLSLIMVISMLPVGALATTVEETVAAQEQETTAPAQAPAEETPVTVSRTIVPDVGLPENEELYQIYVEQQFYGNNSVSFLGESARGQLTTIGGKLYDYLKANIQDIASGKRASTKMELTADDLAAWGVTTEFEAETVDAAYSMLLEQLEEAAVISALLHDCPYDLYWYDKTTGVTTSGSWYVGGGRFIVGNITISFAVAGNYQGTGYSSSAPTVETSVVSAVTAAAAKAQSIVTAYDAYPDYEKLKAYKEEICSLVSYDTAAASSGNYATDNDPWGLINVFDGDTSTNVVCEGYSKAFQYLCDLSVFSGDVACYSVSGYMSGGTGAGAHMWNIVTIDGKNYLVDVTNSDAGTVGQSGFLFLAGTAGSVTGGYTFNGVTFTYNSDTMNLWGTGESSILHLAQTSYGAESGGEEEPPDVPDTDFPFSDGEWEVLKIVNAERYSAGLKPLTGFAVLQQAADIRAEELAESFSHTRPDGTTCFTVLAEVGLTNYSAAGENIFTGSSSPATAMYAWMNSDGHRANILSGDYSHIGIGNYNYGWTQVFLGNSGYNSMTLYMPDIAHQVGTAIDDMGIYAVLNSSVYGDCYLPILGVYCTGYDPNLCGATQTVTASVLGYTVSFAITTTGHSEVIDAAVEATCTSTGLTQGEHCSVCGAVLVEQEVVPMLDHSFGEWAVSAVPTCTEKGTERRDCENCSHYETREVAALGHTEVIDAEAAPTCTETGLTEGKHCSACGEVLVAQQVVEAAGHKWDGGTVTKEPTEKEMGLRTYTCASCGAEKTENIPMLEHTHSYSSVVTVPTCTEQGYTTHTCAGCGDSYVDSYVDTAGHKYSGWTVTASPTCTEDGERTRICSVCGAAETETIALLGHTVETDAAVDATCTENGLTEGSHCSACGEVLVAQEVVNAPGHSFENGVCVSCGEAEPLVYSGTCGENLTWCFDKDSGTLTISGTGAMEDYTEGTAPWYALISGIHSIIVEAGVTYIGDYAFCGEGYYYTVTIPASVTELGSNLFIRDIEYIDVAFLGDAPAVQADTFTDICTYVSYPYSNPTYTQAFKDACGGKIIWCPVDDTGMYKAMGGCGEDLIWMLDYNGVLTIEGFGDMEIYYAAMSPWWGYRGEIEKVVLPEGLTSIRTIAFGDMNAFADIEIPASVTRIEQDAFGNCTGLETITFLGDAPQFAESVFPGVTATAYYPANNATWTEEVRQSYGGNITWVAAQEPLEWSFDETTGTLTITGEGSMDDYTVDAPAPWNGFADQVCTVRFEGNVTAIGSRAFVDCTALESVTIPDSVTYIGKEAFFGCTAMTVLNLGNGVETVDENAFASCTDLTTVSIPASAEFGKNAFLGDRLINSVVVTPGTGVMTNYDFDSHVELPWNRGVKGVAVTIQDGVTNIGSYAFYGSGVTSVSIPSTVTAIGDYAFVNCDSLTAITIPFGVETIGDRAFSGTYNITSIELPNSVREIGDYAFAGSGYQSVTLPHGLAEISKGMFESCGSLTSVSIPSSVKTIGSSAFSYCSALKGVVIPEGVTTLGSDCFAGCSIYSLSLPQTLTDIGSRAFAQNWNLITVTIPAGVRTIREYAFYDCSYLSLLIVESLDLTVESNAFKNCGNLHYIGFAGTSSQWENGVALESGCGIENVQVEYNTTYQPLSGVKILNEWGADVSGTTGVMDLSKDNTIVLSAEPLPEDYSYSYFIEWGVDSDIVSGKIDEYGNLKLKGLKPGTVTITAIIYEVFGDEISGIAVTDYTLQIKRYVSSIEISGGYNGYIATGMPTALTAAVKPKNAENTDVTWRVENVTGAATIDSNGVITGTAPGKVYVWAMAVDGSGVGDLLELTVADYGVEITGAAEVMGGKSITLKAQLLPYNMTKTSIVWSLADPDDSAYVTLKNGKLTAKKVTQQHDVTVLASVKDGSARTGSITVTVVPTVASVVIARDGENVSGTVSYDLNDPNLTGMTFSAATLPLDAKDGITWTVSDKKGAYAEYVIDGSEISIANPTGKTGTVTLTAKATDGSGKTATVKIHFAKLAQSVAITNATEKLRGGAKVTLKTDIASDKSLTDKNVVWSVSDASVPYASVSAKGVLTTKAVYEQVTIEVTAQVKANPEKTHTVEITLCPAVTAAQIRSGGALTTKGQTIYVDLADPTVNLTGSMLPASAIQEGTWTSSNKKIATVADGKVTVQKAGTATLTFKASDGSNKSTTIKIVAGKWVDSIDVYTANDQHELRSGKTLQLKSKVLAADGGKPTNAGLTWTVSNTAAASVSSAGKVTAKTVYANTWVTVTATAKDGSGVSRSYDILIKPAKEETLILKLNGENVTASTQIRDLEAAEAELLTAWIYNSETETMEQVEPKFTLSNKFVSLAEGALTAVKTGSTVVTAKYGKLSAKVTIKVVRHVDTITVTSRNGATTLVSGRNLQLKAVASPSNATTKTVTWTVSDPNAASVTSAGKVTAKTVYQQTPVTVTATAKDGSGVAAEFQLMIYPAAAGVTIKDTETGRTMNNRTVTVYLSQTQGMDLDAIVFPTGGDGAMQSVKWSSSSNKIASVDAEGNVTFLKTGTVTIKATTIDGTNKSTSFKLVIKK